jgi:transposase-like protein
MAGTRGRPRFVPTEEQRNQVKAMRANGDPIRAIARAIGIGYTTLRSVCRVELREGREDSISRVGLTLFTAALTDWHAAEKWLRLRGGQEWQPAERRFVGGIADAPPIPLDVNARVTIYLPDNGRAKIPTGADPAAAAAPGPMPPGASNDAC